MMNVRRRPDVDRDDAALARIDVEEGRLAPAPGFAGGALEDRAVAESARSTSRLTAPRRVPMRRARSAREIGWLVRIRFSAMPRLIARVVPRVATRMVRLVADRICL